MEDLFNILLILFIVGLTLFGLGWLFLKISHWESPQRVAGKRGESHARFVIQSIMREDDILISNVSLEEEGKPAEFDNIIVNDKGVFIIEVKNYVGHLDGEEDNFEWVKYKISATGNTYQKLVKNPISQVKRQIYILSKFLKNNNVNVWINGYVYLVHKNCPIESSYVLASDKDIDEAIHGKKEKVFSDREKKKVVELLEGLSTGNNRG